MWALPEDTSDILLKDADGIRKAEKGGRTGPLQLRDPAVVLWTHAVDCPANV